MFKTSFVQFSDDHVIYNRRHFDDYLAFPPEPVLYNDPMDNNHEVPSETHPSYRYFSGKDFCWFECKDIQPSASLSM